MASTIFLLAGFDSIDRLSFIPAVIILCREILVSGLREILLELKVPMPVTRLAKWKTAIQMLALSSLMLNNMGPGGVLYDPRYFTDGPVTLESEIFHFPSSANNEYGFFLGGSGLEDGGGRHVAFVFRGDGSVAAWEKGPSGSRMLADWRRAEAILASDGKGIVRNVMRLVVSRREVVLRANGLDVLILPARGPGPRGTFGFRVGARGKSAV